MKALPQKSQNSGECLPQRRKEILPKRGSALRLCAFAGTFTASPMIDGAAKAA